MAYTEEQLVQIEQIAVANKWGASAWWIETIQELVEEIRRLSTRKVVPKAQKESGGRNDLSDCR